MSTPTRPSTYDALIEASFSMLNADPTASLAEIATAAGVSRATLHRHFTGRDDLILALALKAIDETGSAANLAANSARSHTDALRQIMRAMIELGDRHWFLAQEPIHRFSEVRSALAHQSAEFNDLVKSVKKEGLFYPSCPDTWISQTYDHLIHAAWEVVRTGHVTREQATNLAWKTLTKGLKQAKF